MASRETPAKVTLEVTSARLDADEDLPAYPVWVTVTDDGDEGNVSTAKLTYEETVALREDLTASIDLYEALIE